MKIIFNLLNIFYDKIHHFYVNLFIFRRFIYKLLCITITIKILSNFYLQFIISFTFLFFIRLKAFLLITNVWVINSIFHFLIWLSIHHLKVLPLQLHDIHLSFINSNILSFNLSVQL